MPSRFTPVFQDHKFAMNKLQASFTSDDVLQDGLYVTRRDLAVAGQLILPDRYSVCHGYFSNHLTTILQTTFGHPDRQLDNAVFVEKCNLSLFSSGTKSYWRIEVPYLSYCCFLELILDRGCLISIRATRIWVGEEELLYQA